MKNDFSKLLVLIVICAGAATQSSLLAATVPAGTPLIVDRKSTRLNSSHLVISYAVFCLKKKKNRSGSHPRRSIDSFDRHSLARGSPVPAQSNIDDQQARAHCLLAHAGEQPAHIPQRIA